MWCHYDYLSAPNRDGASPNSNRKYQTCRSTQITGCCVLLQLKLGSHKHDMKAANVLCYCRNLGSLRYGMSTASCLKTLWEKPFFLLTEALLNLAVKLHSHWFVQCVKNEPMARQQSCTSLWRRSPPEWSEPSGYISGRFAIGTPVSSTEATTESCSYPAWQVRSTRSVSQGTEVTTFRYSTSYCILFKDAMGTPFNHAMLIEE